MTCRFVIPIFAISFISTSAVSSCGQSHPRETPQTGATNKPSGLSFDTSKTAIIPFDHSGSSYFDSSCKPAILTQDELDSIDSLLIVCVKDYNRSLGNSIKRWAIDLKKDRYKKQLVVATTGKGEKEVWVNCLCDSFNDPYWKDQIISVQDGGSCFFNFRINLATKKYSDMSVNGVA